MRLLDDVVHDAEAMDYRTLALRIRIRRLEMLLPEVGRAEDNAWELADIEARALDVGFIALIGKVRCALGVIALHRGDHEAARSALAESLALRPTVVAEGLLGVTDHDRGRLTEAVGHYARAAEHAARIGYPHSVALWRAHLDLAERQRRGNAPVPPSFSVPPEADAATAAAIRHCARPDLTPRDGAFRSLWWWPALDRILDRARA